jgi:hypothetical protein
MASLFALASQRQHRLPEEIRQAIIQLKAEYAPLSPHEIAAMWRDLSAGSASVGDGGRGTPLRDAVPVTPVGTVGPRYGCLADGGAGRTAPCRARPPLDIFQPRLFPDELDDVATG